MGPNKGLFNEQNLEMFQYVFITLGAYINLTFTFWCETVGGGRRYRSLQIIVWIAQGMNSPAREQPCFELTQWPEFRSWSPVLPLWSIGLQGLL